MARVKKVLAMGLAGIAALTAGSVAGIWVLTEPDANPAPGRASSVASPEPTAYAGPPAGVTPAWIQTMAAPAAAPPPAPAPAAAPLAMPGDLAAAARRDSTRFAPRPNVARPIAGPAPQELPTNRGEREDALLAARRQRFANQMDALNRRTAARGGTPSPETPPTPPRGVRSNRRGSLVADEQ
jgi:hypothetical protein